MIRRDPIHIHGRGRHSTEKVAAAHYQPNLHAGAGHFGDLLRQALHSFRFDAERASTGENLAA
jgi:hypothetical protein